MVTDKTNIIASAPSANTKTKEQPSAKTDVASSAESKSLQGEIKELKTSIAGEKVDHLDDLIDQKENKIKIFF